MYLNRWLLLKEGECSLWFKVTVQNHIDSVQHWRGLSMVWNIFLHIIWPEPIGVNFDCELCQLFCQMKVVPHGCNTFRNCIFFKKTRSPWAYCLHPWQKIWTSVKDDVGGKIQNRFIKSTKWSQRRNIDPARPMTFQMAVFLQVNWWLSQSETLHHLLLGWSAVIADIWCRYQIVTSGKTTWTYADSGQPSGFLDSQIRKIFQVKISDQSEYFIGIWGHKNHHYLGIIWRSIIK